MFTFHKPRVYRSTEGCCICRAKSSSSRFTDSKKYEFDFMKCFDLKQPRYGEICNACVLLVKRYKRLPVGSNRHWGHVVDARAGPGTKSLTKHKRLRDEAAELSNVSGGGGGHVSTYNGKSLISEKFSKIFKKNKKSKSNLQPPTAAPSCTTKRKSTSSSASYSWNNTQSHRQSLPHSPDSFDSDYEDDHITTSNSNMVEFQTQTRASTYRSRNEKNINAAICFDGGTRDKRGGSMRRKCLLPRKRNSAITENSVQFFDENEWQQQQSCCGPVYECATLGGAIIVDLEFYKPCLEHQKKSIAKEMLQNHQVSLSVGQSQLKLPQQQEQQQQPHQQMQPQKAIVGEQSSAITKPTQVLKKHHLFFKRQSELFPQTDLSANQFEACSDNQIQTTSATAAAAAVAAPPASKTDLPMPIICTTTARATVDSSTETSLTLSRQSTMTPINTNTSTIGITIPITSRHSISKVASHSSAPAAVFPCNNNLHVNKVASNVLHKIKATADAGKISKHSLEKINPAAVRILPADLNDMRQILKTVDRSYLLSKPHQQQHQQPAMVNLQQPQQHHISIVAPHQLTLNATKLSPTLSAPSTISSCSMAPKFSDNSSDSGFDENLQDRKSASPLQEDTDIKMLTRPNIPNGKKIFSTGGVNTYCPAQSMPLQPGIDEANKLRQQYRQHALPTTIHQRNYQNRTGGVKIAQIIAGGGGNNNYSNNNSTTQHKMNMRAHVYNNNTIKHENGVTTIVPASSLAASSQAATLSALAAPNTVTITPSPLASVSANFKKGACSGAAGIVCGTGGGGGLTMATASATTPLNTISNNNNNTPNLNQKIIFVKTTKYNNNNNNSISVTSAAAAGGGSTQLPHNAFNSNSTTMMSTATTPTTITSPPLPLSAATPHHTTLNNVLSCGSAQQQNVCVKIDCNS